MSTQQDIYAAGSKNHPLMLNKDNYIPWSSRIIRYAWSRPNGKMIVDSIENGPYVRRMIATPGEPDLRSDIGEQEKKAKLFNEWEKFTSTDENGLVVIPGIANQNGTGNIVAARAKGSGNGNQARCYNCRGLGYIARNCIARPRKRDAAYLQTQLLIAQKEEAGIQLQAKEFDFMATAGDLDEIEEVNANCILMENLQHASTSGTQLEKAPVYDTDGSAENDNHVTSIAPSMVQSGGTVEISSAHSKEIRVFVPQMTKSKEELFLSNISNIITASKTISIPNEDLSDDTTPSIARKFLNEVKSSLVTLQRVVKQKMTFKVHNWSSSAHKEEKEYTVLWNNWYTKCEECKYDKISYDKAYNEMQQKVERLQAQLRDLKGKSSDTPSTSNTLDPLNQKLESKIVELEFQVVNNEHEISHLKTTYKNLFDSITSNRAHAKLHNIVYKNAKLRARLFENTFDSMKCDSSGTSVTPHVDKPKLIAVNPHSKKLHASIPSHSVPQPREFNVVKHSNEKVSSDMVNASATGLEHTARTRRPQPKSNTRNARIPSASKSSKVKKNVTVEDQRRILLLSKNQKTMSSKCNNIKLAIRNDKSKIICGTCKQCLVTANHDACFLSPVNALNSRANNLCAYASPNANQKRHRIQVWKPKQVGFKERLACRLQRNTCFIRDLDGVDLFKGNRSINLYTIILYDMASTSHICLMARATPTKLWLWHQRLSHLNFDTINELAKNNLVSGLLKFKYAKEHLCPSCEQGKSKRASHPPKPVLNSKQRLHLLYMDLCGPMRVATNNGKWYVLQNGVVERRNHTLVEAARTMLIFSHASFFLWAEAIATVCYTQNHSIIHRRFNKTPYEFIQGRKPDISYLHVFGALCYSKNDREDIGIGYNCGYLLKRRKVLVISGMPKLSLS
nr:integrase, catalytic region, zinc finger, CCHC-type, peptidase aspartic, catalytic [Tanacetum cinerariifolium]